MDPGSAGRGDQTQAPPPDVSLAAFQAQGRVLSEHGRLLREASTAVQSLNDRLQAQETRQQGRSSQLQDLAAMIQALSAQVATLMTPPAPPAPAAAPPPPPALPAGQPREPSLASPRPFDGTFALFRGFVMQCELIFSHQPSQYFSPAARVAFIANLTTGDALNWAQAILSARPDLFNDYAAFLSEFRRVFDHPTAGQDVGARLMTLHQGNRTVAAYSTEFRTLAAGCGWNDMGLRSAFRQGLSEAIKDELIRERSATLDELVALAIDVDERIRERRRERARHQLGSPRLLDTTPGTSASRANTSSAREPAVATTSGEEPMQLGRTRLTAAERERRRSQGLCLYCGERGHLRDACPSLPKE